MEFIFIDGTTIDINSIDRCKFPDNKEVYLFTTNGERIVNSKVNAINLNSFSTLQIAMVIATRVGRLTTDKSNVITLIADNEYIRALASISNRVELLENVDTFIEKEEEPVNNVNNILFDDLNIPMNNNISSVSGFGSLDSNKEEEEELNFDYLLGDTDLEEMKKNMILDNEMESYGQITDTEETEEEEDLGSKLDKTIHGFTSYVKANNKDGIKFEKPI